MRSRASGFTIIEMLMVLAVLGILAGIAAPRLRVQPARPAANAIASVMRQARFDALRLNSPTVVTVDPAERVVRVHRSTSAASVDCGSAASETLHSTSLVEYGGIELTGDALQFVWLPNGQSRSCSGGRLVSELVLNVSRAQTTLEVAVSTGGEVTVR